MIEDKKSSESPPPQPQQVRRTLKTVTSKDNLISKKLTKITFPWDSDAQDFKITASDFEHVAWDITEEEIRSFFENLKANPYYKVRSTTASACGYSMFLVALLILISALASAIIAHIVLYILVFFFLATFVFQVIFLSIWATYREKQRKVQISKIIKDANEETYIAKGLVWKVDDTFKTLELSQGANYQPHSFSRMHKGSENETEMEMSQFELGDIKRTKVTNEEDVFSPEKKGQKFGFKNEKGGSRLKLAASSTLTQDTKINDKKEEEKEEDSEETTQKGENKL